MAKYGPITKTLKKAVPTIKSDTGIVKSWEVEVVYAYGGDETKDLPAWKTSYSETEDVEYLGKTANQFTKSDLISFMGPQIENSIFEAHYEAYNLPAKEERQEEFDLNSLSN